MLRMNGLFFVASFLAGMFVENVNVAFTLVFIILMAQLGYNIVKLKRMG